jgi:O-antigen ligase
MTLRELHWSLIFLVWTGGIIGLGAVLGALLFPLAGLIFQTDKSGVPLAVFGARTLGFYFMVWAPGIALVLTVKNEYERRQPKSVKRQ